MCQKLSHLNSNLPALNCLTCSDLEFLIQGEQRVPRSKVTRSVIILHSWCPNPITHMRWAGLWRASFAQKPDYCIIMPDSGKQKINPIQRAVMSSQPQLNHIAISVSDQAPLLVGGQITRQRRTIVMWSNRIQILSPNADGLPLWEMCSISNSLVLHKRKQRALVQWLTGETLLLKREFMKRKKWHDGV